jgi:ABC-type uncharacterized transport system auxiliary subunit
VSGLRPALAFAVAAVVAACTGSLFRSKVAPPVIYELSAGGAPAADSRADGALAAEIPADLTVLKPRLRSGLETDRIAVLYPDRHLDYFADARWSGPLSEVLQDFAVQEFHAHANLRTVSADSTVFQSAYWLELEVTEFQADYTTGSAAPTVHVHVLARLGRSDDRHILGQFAADARQTAAENRLAAIVDAYAHAADAAFTAVAARVHDTFDHAAAVRSPGS